MRPYVPFVEALNMVGLVTSLHCEKKKKEKQKQEEEEEKKDEGDEKEVKEEKEEKSEVKNTNSTWGVITVESGMDAIHLQDGIRDEMNCTVRYGNCFLKIPLKNQPSCLALDCQPS